MDGVVAALLVQVETEKGVSKGKERIHWTPERALVGRSIWN
jgi:hypothetical protein